MTGPGLYERVGESYARGRRADPRIARRILEALGPARSVVNVGAGTGSYEPTDRDVLAVEPAAAMRAHRPAAGAPCIDAVAERLPLPDRGFDAALAVYTDFHWSDRARGLAELVRVSRQVVVVLTVDRAGAERYWLTRDYLPGANALFAPLSAVTSELGAECEVAGVPIPHDCTDGFAQAFWKRPEALLDPERRAAMALFERLEPAVVVAALASLGRDLASGAWAARNAELAGAVELDLGHRLVVWRHPA